MPTETSVAPNTNTDKQEVKGPDGKTYRFSKSISQDRIDKYFAKKGITKKDTKKGDSGPTKSQVDLMKNMEKRALPNPAMPDYSGELLPTAGGIMGGIIGGRVAGPNGARSGAVLGAGIGGAAGEASRELWRRITFNENITAKDAVMKTAGEGVKQAALEYGGQKVGELFFKALSKIPHAEVRDGIPLLPSEAKPGGKVYRFVEDLFSNIFSASKVMDDFRTGQSKAINAKLETFAKGMSNFKGTSEQLGELIQKVLRDGDTAAQKSIKDYKVLQLKKGRTAKQIEMDLSKTNLYKNYIQDFKNKLSQEIVKANNPAAIAGLIRTPSESVSGVSHADVRAVKDLVNEHSPELWGKVQNRLMNDIINEALMGAKDPINKVGGGNISGDKLKSLLNGIGEERLKIIYGDKGYENIEKFSDLIKNVRGEHTSGLGKMANIFLFLSPIRSGLSTKTMMKASGTAYLVNRLAKVMTSTEGVEITNRYVRATIQHSPQLVNAALEEYKKFNERTDKEYDMDEQEGERQYEEYQKSKGKQ